MNALVVTEEYALKALQFGACKTIQPGTPVSRIDASDLSWADAVGLIDVKLELPIWALGKNGYGSGSGYGYGYGSGYGTGYG